MDPAALVPRIPALPGVLKTSLNLPMGLPLLREKEHLALTCLLKDEGKHQAPKPIHQPTAHGGQLSAPSMYHSSWQQEGDVSICVHTASPSTAGWVEITASSNGWHHRWRQMETWGQWV